MRISLAAKPHITLILKIVIFGLSVTPLLLGFIWLHLKIGGWDWETCLRPATIALFSGKSPYDRTICAFLSPPWTLLLLAPFTLLPESISGVLIGLVNIGVTAVLVQRLGGRPLSVIAIALSYPVIWGALLSQTDWIPMLGLLLPPQIGLFFVLVKPQIGMSIAIYWLILSLQQGGLREAIRVFLPVTLAFIGSFAIFGFYLLGATSQISTDWNVSPWPYAIPIGILLLYLALKKSNIQPAILSSFMFSPYINKCSLSFPLLSLAKFPTLAVLVSLILWVFFGIRQIF